MKKPPGMSLVIGVGGKPKPYDAHEEEGEESMFKLPEGMELKPGEMKEVVCTIEGKDDGMACVRKVQGMEVPGYEDKGMDDDKQMPSSDTFTEAAMPEEAGGDEQEAM